MNIFYKTPYRDEQKNIILEKFNETIAIKMQDGTLHKEFNLTIKIYETTEAFQNSINISIEQFKYYEAHPEEVKDVKTFTAERDAYKKLLQNIDKNL